jgi:hypothetical protein
MHVVMLAHPNAKQFKDPTTDPYDRYGIKVHERASALSARSPMLSRS